MPHSVCEQSAKKLSLTVIIVATILLLTGCVEPRNDLEQISLRGEFYKLQKVLHTKAPYPTFEVGEDFASKYIRSTNTVRITGLDDPNLIHEMAHAIQRQLYPNIKYRYVEGFAVYVDAVIAETLEIKLDAAKEREAYFNDTGVNLMGVYDRSFLIVSDIANGLELHELLPELDRISDIEIDILNDNYLKLFDNWRGVSNTNWKNNFIYSG